LEIFRPIAYNGQMITPDKIIAGGQTGADRAGLDWAIFHDIPHGGWCPKGRKAEDGAIAAHYLLSETPSASYLQRTEWNVRDSDATVIFTLSFALSAGSKRTADFARKHAKPCLHISKQGSYESPGERLAAFVSQHGVKVLNVAGTRGSKEPQAARFAKQTLEDAFFPRPQSPWLAESCCANSPDEG
jgi:hypothetical protein